MCQGTSTNAERSRLRSTNDTSRGMSAISPGALVAGYLGLGSILLATGFSRAYVGGLVAHVAVLAVVAAATWMRGVPPWLRARAPVLAIPFLYVEMPMLIRAVGHPDL